MTPPNTGSLVDDLGYLADRASTFDLSVASLEAMSFGSPISVGVVAEPGTSTRESELRSWLERIQPEGHCILFSRGDQVHLRVRGLLTDDEGIGSVVVSVFAIYNRLDDAVKVRVMRANVDTASPADLLTMVEQAV